MSEWLKILSNIERNPGIRRDAVASLAQKHSFPEEYVELFAFMNGGEGLLGENYVRFYSLEDTIWLNDDMPLSELRGGFFIFGSNGGGEAYAFDQKSGNQIVQVPFIPLARTYAVVCCNSLQHWVEMQAKALPPANRDFIGKEIHEIKPVVFGGDPIDPANKVALDLRKYAEAVVWFNKLYQQLKTDAR